MRNWSGVANIFFYRYANCSHRLEFRKTKIDIAGFEPTATLTNFSYIVDRINEDGIEL